MKHFWLQWHWESLICRLPLSVPSLCGNHTESREEPIGTSSGKSRVSPQVILSYSPVDTRALCTRGLPDSNSHKVLPQMQSRTWPAQHLHTGYCHGNHDKDKLRKSLSLAHQKTSFIHSGCLSVWSFSMQKQAKWKQEWLIAEVSNLARLNHHRFSFLWNKMPQTRLWKENNNNHLASSLIPHFIHSEAIQVSFPSKCQGDQMSVLITLTP